MKSLFSVLPVLAAMLLFAGEKLPLIRPSEIIRTEIVKDESGVPHRQIPSVLVNNDGSTVSTAWEWMTRRRPEVMDFYRKEVFGELPPRPDSMRCEIISEKRDALDNSAVRREIKVTFSMNNGRSHSMTVLLYKPQNITKPVPVFVELNFRGNHAVSSENDVQCTGYNCDGKLVYEKRGGMKSRLPAKLIVSRGFAVATVCYHEIFPDLFTDVAVRSNEIEMKSWKKSIYGMFFPDADIAELKKKYTAISAWAWGMSRILDVLESDPEIDRRKAGVCGHSRLGKTSLWAGANDERFKIVVTNNSGHGGAALFKRRLGETVESLLAHFPHWFVTGFAAYARKDADLTWDQNFLLSLIAPRALCIGSATEDWWADPKGEFLAGVHASEVYRLFGICGMPVAEQPKPDVNVTGAVSYHLRTGKHAILAQDWDHYLTAAETILGW